MRHHNACMRTCHVEHVTAHMVQPAVGVLRVLADDKRTAALVSQTPGLPAMLAAQLGAFRDQEVREVWTGQGGQELGAPRWTSPRRSVFEAGPDDIPRLPDQQCAELRTARL